MEEIKKRTGKSKRPTQNRTFLSASQSVSTTEPGLFDL